MVAVLKGKGRVEGLARGDGKIAIRTKKFGTVYRGNEAGKLDTYEMTDVQIKQLKAFLGSCGRLEPAKQGEGADHAQDSRHIAVAGLCL
jgi:hypothetical protein